MSFVYAVSNSENGLVKVGMSRNLDQRTADLCRPTHCNLIYSIECKEARLTERVAHSLLNGYGRGGEWFAVTEDQAVYAIKKAHSDVIGPRELAAKLEGPTITLRADPELLQLIDDWRREEEDLPVRSEAIRRMLKAEGERRQKGKKR